MLPSGLLSQAQNAATDKSVQYQDLLTNIGSNRSDNSSNVQNRDDDSFKEELKSYSSKNERREREDKYEYEAKEVISDPKRTRESENIVSTDAYIKEPTDPSADPIVKAANEIKDELIANGALPEELEDLEGSEFLMGFLGMAITNMNEAPDLNAGDFDLATYLKNAVKNFLPPESAEKVASTVTQLLTGEESKQPLLDYIKQADIGGLKITPALKSIIDHYSGQDLQGKDVAANLKPENAAIANSNIVGDDDAISQSQKNTQPTLVTDNKNTEDGKVQLNSNTAANVATNKADNGNNQQQSSTNQQGSGNQQFNNQPTVSQQVASEAENSVKALIEASQQTANKTPNVVNAAEAATNPTATGITAGAVNSNTPTITIESAAAPTTAVQQVTYGADGAQKTVTVTKNHAAATEQIQVSVTKALNSGQNQMKIQLDPIELGKVDIRLSWSEGGKTSVHIIVEKPETFSMLQKDAASLEKALADSGFSMDQQNLQFSLKQGNQYSGNDNDEENIFGELMDDLHEEEIETATLNVRHNYVDGEAVDLSV